MAQAISNAIKTSSSYYRPTDALKKKPSAALKSMSIAHSPKPATNPASFTAGNALTGNTPSFKMPPQQPQQGGGVQGGGVQNMQSGGGSNYSTQGMMPPPVAPVAPTTSPRTLKQNPPKPPKPLFNNILDSLQGKSDTSDDQKRAMEDMRRTAAENKAIADNAAGISKQYGDEINRVGQLGAGAVAGNLSTGTNVVGSGNAAIASQSASARMDALAAGQSAALRGTEQQLTAQAQTADAYNNTLTGANTQQGQFISALTNAAGLAQPVQVSPGNTLFSPTSGDEVAGGLGGYVGYNTAQQVMGLISQYPDAGYKYDQNLSPQQNLQMAQNAIQQSPTYQKSTYGVPGQGSVAGAAGVETAKQGYNQAFQSKLKLTEMKDYADSMTSNLSQVMSQYSIGDNDARKVNELFNVVRRQFGSEGQAAFEAALKETQVAYSGLLATTGGLTPTEASATKNILDPNATLKQVMASITELKKAGEARMSASSQQVDSYWNQLLSASGGQGGGNQGGGGGGEWGW